MKHGYFKAALATPKITVGAVNKNLEEIRAAVLKANAQKSELIAFGEMSLTGSTLGSMSGYDQLLNSAENALKQLIAFSKEVACAIIVGLPLKVNGIAHSCAAVVHGGILCGIVAKDTGNCYDNICAYVAGEKLTLNGKPIFNCPNHNFSFGVCIGEDFDEINPVSQKLVSYGADVIVNISSGKALIDSYENRINKINILSKRLICSYLYVSTGFGESVARNVFSGDKIACENGEVIESLEGDNFDNLYAEIDVDGIVKAKQFNLRAKSPDASVLQVDIKNQNTDVTREIDNLPFVPNSAEFDRILDIMGRGIYSRMLETKSEKVIFGLSGGLDSTMVLIACEKMFNKYKLDQKNIIAVTMSSSASSERTKSNALNLIKALKVSNIDIPITNAVESHLRDINHTTTNDVVYENAQARERAQILLDLSNKHGALMLGTGDLSEIALGWSTYGGDQLAQYNPNSSLTKTLIRAIMRNYCLTSKNSKAAVIVNDVLLTPVSPELLPNQDTEKLLGPYELHDFYLYNLIGKGYSVEKVVYLARLAFPDISKKVIINHLKTFVIRFFSNQFKRNAGCDGIQVTEFDLSDKVIYSEYSDEQYLFEIEKMLSIN